MVESMKFQATQVAYLKLEHCSFSEVTVCICLCSPSDGILSDYQACIHEGSEPIQFFSIFQSFIVFKV